MALDVDLDREQDIEELRRIAQARRRISFCSTHLPSKAREVERLRGKPGDLQLTIKILETLQAEAKAAEDAVARRAEQQRRVAECGPMPAVRSSASRPPSCSAGSASGGASPDIAS